MERAMVSFTGSYTGEVDVPIEVVFTTATRPDLLERWVNDQFHNVRLVKAEALAEGVRFHADEVLAESSDEFDHVYQVSRFAFPTAFSLSCLQGPPFTADLDLEQISAVRTRIRWTN